MPKTVNVNESDLRSWAKPALEREIERLNVLLRACQGPPARRENGSVTVATPKRKRSHMSAASRKAVSERMKAYWANKKKGKK